MKNPIRDDSKRRYGVDRGGTWGFDALFVRVSFSNAYEPNRPSYGMGFRIVRNKK